MSESRNGESRSYSSYTPSYSSYGGESRGGESRSYSSYTPSYSSYGGESRGGESRYSYFSAQRNEFMGRIRCKTGSINNDIGDDRRNVMKELEKELGKIEGESR